MLGGASKKTLGDVSKTAFALARSIKTIREYPWTMPSNVQPADWISFVPNMIRYMSAGVFCVLRLSQPLRMAEISLALKLT